MAVTYIGTAKTKIIYGNDSTSQYLFSVENGVQSKVDVHVKRLYVQMNCLSVLTTVMPLIKTYRATSITGGDILSKEGPFDTSLTSDNNVIFRGQCWDTSRMGASPGDIVWQNFAMRMHTAVEQQIAEDRNVLPLLLANNLYDFVLHPGESIVVRLVGATNASNPYGNTHFFVNCVWEENSLSTFNISGIVTLSSSAVEGAKVIIVEADDELLTNGYIKEIITTPAGGNWSSTIRTGKVGAAFIQYKNGGIYYTAPGSPFLS